VDATNGLDVSVGALTMTGTNIDLDPTGTFALDMDAAQTATITIADNLADSFLIQEGANAYLDITTTDAAEAINLGNSTTNPTLSQLGTGQVTFAGNVDATNGLDVSVGALTMTGTNIDLDPTGSFALDMDAGQAITMTLADNLASAFLLQETGIGNYLGINTTDASERIVLYRTTRVQDDTFLYFGNDEDGSIEYDETIDALVMRCDSGISPGTVAYTAFENITQGDCVMLMNDVGTLKVQKAQADADSNAYVYGIALETVTAGNPCRVAGPGSVVVVNTGFTAAGDAGLPVYLSAATAGALTKTAPAGANQVKIRVGFVAKIGGAGVAMIVISVGDPIVRA
jgi:hypothetical protein